MELYRRHKNKQLIIFILGTKTVGGLVFFFRISFTSRRSFHSSKSKLFCEIFQSPVMKPQSNKAGCVSRQVACHANIDVQPYMEISDFQTSLTNTKDSKNLFSKLKPDFISLSIEDF